MIRNQQAYLAAIALNNAGVMLLHRQMHHEAVATMQDALRMMRYSFPLAPSDERNDLHCVPMSICEEALQSCWTRTCAAKIPEDQSNPLKFGKQILIVTDQDNPSVVYETLRLTPDALCAIKIDPLECLTDCDNVMDRLEIESSTLLYNYAIASICFAEGMVVPLGEIRQNAVTMLKLAQLGATKLLNEALSISSNPLNIPSSLLLVAMLLLDTLCQICDVREILEFPWVALPFANDLNLLLAIVTESEIVLSKEGIGLKSVSPAA
jgi:hypothetical protein